MESLEDNKYREWEEKRKGWINVGLVAIDRRIDTGRLVMGMLQQNDKTKEIKITEDW